MYTLYPPGLTVIIYDGFRHTRARTLFKAQIYLNKNKNKTTWTRRLLAVVNLQWFSTD